MRVANMDKDEVRQFNLLRIAVFLTPFLLYLPVFTGKVLLWGTAGLQFVPWRYAAYQMLDQGILPLWNALNGMGAPLAANYQSALFYPPAYFLYGLYQLGGAAGLGIGFTVLIPLHLGWGGVGMVNLVAQQKIGLRGQILAGLAFALGGYLVARSSFYSMVWAGVWLPWLILAVDRLVCVREYDRRIGRILPVALILCMQLLAGHAQLTFYSILLAGIWSVGQILGGGLKMKAILNILFDLFLAGSMATGLALIQLLPTFEFLQQSQRASAYEFSTAMTYSFWPWHFLNYFLPDLFGNPGFGDYWGFGAYWEDAVYMGLFGVGFAISTLPLLIKFPDSLFAGTRIRKSCIWSAWILIAVAFLLSLGTHTPIYRWLYAHVFSFDMFQAPARWMFWAVFLLSILAAIGIETWTRPLRQSRKILKLTFVGSLAVAIAGIGAQLFMRELHTGIARGVILFGMNGMVIIQLLLHTPGTQAQSFEIKRWNWMLFGVATLDLLMAGIKLNPMTSASFFATPIQASSPDLVQPARTFFSAEAEYDLKFNHFLTFESFLVAEPWKSFRRTGLPNFNLLDGQALINNFDPLMPATFSEWFDQVDSLPVEEKTAALSKVGVNQLVEVDSAGSVKTFMLDNKAESRLLSWSDCLNLPAQGLSVQQAGVKRLVDDSDPCIIVESIDRQTAIEVGSPAQLTDLEFDSSKIEFRVTSDHSGWVEVFAVWYPGWQVMIDGQPGETLLADGVFQAVWIPAGDHQVVLTYRPLSFLIGTLVSGVGWIGLILWIIASRQKNLPQNS